jgi:hypothetical protein
MLEIRGSLLWGIGGERPIHSNKWRGKDFYPAFRLGARRERFLGFPSSPIGGSSDEARRLVLPREP